MGEKSSSAWEEKEKLFEYNGVAEMRMYDLLPHGLLFDGKGGNDDSCTIQYHVLEKGAEDAGNYPFTAARG